ncbi:MAG: PEP-CTERM sorting domain-containing protein [Opitutaceae bacterium]|nr:PEP-CTERM sorting domain-containing protein [Opitutaceae bacterium]
MKRPRGTHTLLAIGIILGSILTAGAQVSVTWTGLGSYDGTDVAENWLGDVLPLNDGTEEFIFGDSARHSVTFYTDINARRLSITGITRPYHLDDDYGDLTIGADGLVYAPAQPLFSQIGAYRVYVPQNQTWDIQSGGLALEYYVSGIGQITKTGSGTLMLQESYNEGWSGGLVLSGGRVAIGSGASTSLGTGTLVFNGGTLIASSKLVDGYYSESDVRVGNPVVSNGTIRTENDDELSFEGLVMLAADTIIAPTGRPLFIEGGISETGGARKLTIDAEGAVIVTGSSGWTGGTDVTKGVLIFGGEDNTPGITGGILVRSDGYAGIGVDNNVGLFLSEIDAASAGTIGFDSDLSVGLDHFDTPISLTGLNGTVRLGSATGAVLDPAAVITPFGSTYRFGGGGGTLAVASPLTGARNLDVSSPAELPLTVRLMNTTNDFSGTVNVSNSALIFGDGVALPGGTYTMDRGSYIGTEDPELLPADLLPHFSPATQGIIGFDLGPNVNTTRVIADLNLSAFTNGVYVGTASAVYDTYGEINGPGLRLTGNLTPGQDGNYRFAAYKGGALEVASTLSGASAQVFIGEPNTLGTMGDPNKEEYSTVLLSGQNSHGGATTLYAGRLLLGNEQALGGGALVVQPHNITVPGEASSELYAELGVSEPTGEGLFTVNNPIQLNASLSINDFEPFRLGGTISGTGGLDLLEDASLELSGDNTFSGGVYLRPYAQLTIASPTATGVGRLGFGGGSYSDVYVQTNAPVIHGLDSREDSDYATFHLLQDATVFKVVQPEGTDTKFVGNIHTDTGEGWGTATFVKDGPGTLRVYGDMDFYGIGDQGREAAISAEIRAGTLIVSGNAYGGEYSSYEYSYSYVQLGYDSVLLKGGTLAVNHDTTLGNDIIAESGRLAGHGTFASHPVIGANVTVAPGLANEGPIGRLRFDELTLASGGTLEWNLRDASGEGPAGWDLISIVADTTLYITATSDERFSIKIITLQANGTAGQAANFDPSQAYSWMVIESYSTVGFDPAKFSVDFSQFANSTELDGRNGTFTLSLGGEYGESLMLNFVPVPEPSTYALLGLGLGVVAWSAWRRRRR